MAKESMTLREEIDFVKTANFVEGYNAKDAEALGIIVARKANYDGSDVEAVFILVMRSMDCEPMLKGLEKALYPEEPDGPNSLWEVTEAGLRDLVTDIRALCKNDLESVVWGLYFALEQANCHSDAATLGNYAIAQGMPVAPRTIRMINPNLMNFTASITILKTYNITIEAEDEAKALKIAEEMDAADIADRGSLKEVTTDYILIS